MSRLEKSVPETAAKADANLAASINDIKIDKAPEPLREVIAAKTSERGPDIIEGKPFNRNPSSHMGGYVQGPGTLGSSAGSPPPTLGTLPSFNLSSPPRSGSIEEEMDNSGKSSSGGDEGKSAEEVLADVEASEEIFGKAFRGGPKAAAGLMKRLQKEVRWARSLSCILMIVVGLLSLSLLRMVRMVTMAAGAVCCRLCSRSCMWAPVSAYQYGCGKQSAPFCSCTLPLGVS